MRSISCGRSQIGLHNCERPSDLARYRLSGCLVRVVVQDDVRPGPRQMQAHSPPNAARGSRDQRSLTFEDLHEE